MKIKECFKEVKESKLVQEAVAKVKPTWEVIKKSGGYKILIMSLILSLIFIPIQALIALISKLTIGVAGMNSAMSFIYYIFNSAKYYGGSFLTTVIIFAVVSVIIAIMSFIVTTFIVSNATFKSFKILAEEERTVSIGEYFKLAFDGLMPYSTKLFVNVILPIWVIKIVGEIINFIPYVRGNAIANFSVSILTFALLFRFVAIMLNVDSEKAVKDFTSYWLTFAIITYLVKMVTTLSIITVGFEIAFILYALLLLTGSRHYYGGQEESI